MTVGKVKIIRPETRAAFWAGDYLTRISIMFWCLDGWDSYWPWTDMPRWLKPRYEVPR